MFLTLLPFVEEFMNRVETCCFLWYSANVSDYLKLNAFVWFHFQNGTYELVWVGMRKKRVNLHLFFCLLVVILIESAESYTFSRPLTYCRIFQDPTRWWCHVFYCFLWKYYFDDIHLKTYSWTNLKGSIKNTLKSWDLKTFTNKISKKRKNKY